MSTDACILCLRDDVQRSNHGIINSESGLDVNPPPALILAPLKCKPLFKHPELVRYRV